MLHVCIKAFRLQPSFTLNTFRPLKSNKCYTASLIIKKLSFTFMTQYRIQFGQFVTKENIRIPIWVSGERRAELCREKKI